jgi:hypothetical protein
VSLRYGRKAICGMKNFLKAQFSGANIEYSFFVLIIIISEMVDWVVMDKPLPWWFDSFPGGRHQLIVLHIGR